MQIFELNDQIKKLDINNSYDQQCITSGTISQAYEDSGLSHKNVNDISTFWCTVSKRT